MLTERTNLANLVTPVHSNRPAGKAESSVKDSFSSFVSQGGVQFQQQNTNTDTDLGVKQKDLTTEKQPKEDYGSKKLQSDSYNSKAEELQTKKLPDKQEDNTDLPDLTEEELEALESDIRDVLKKALDLDDAELDQWLTTMNLNVFQLLQPEVMQEFLLTVTDSQPIDLLIDGTLNDTLQVMQEGMEQVLDQYDLEPDVLNDLLEQTDWNQVTELQDQVHVQDESEHQVLSEEIDTQEVEQVEVEAPVITDSQTQKSSETQNKPEDQFTVKEETTGIQVTVKATTERESAGTDAQSGQMEQSQQGIAAGVVNQLAQAVHELEEVPVATFQRDIQQMEIVQQVIEQIKVFSGNDVSRMEVQLYPEHLGRVQIQVMMKSGVMTAQITAETEMAKAAIESQLQQLKTTFQEQSMKVEAVEVSVATSDFQKEKDRQDTAKDQKRQGRGRIRTNGYGMPEDEEADDEQTDQLLEVQGASVEFTA